MNNELKYKLMYMFTYAPVGIISPLIGQYMSQIGFSGTQIGTVTAISTAVAVFASTFWGKKYSNCKDGRKVILFLCLAASIAALISSYITSFILFTIMYGIMYFFQGPIMGLSDAMVLEDKQNFSSIRLWGAIGYAAAVFIAGRIGQSIGLDKIFIMYLATYLVGGGFAMSIKHLNKNDTISEQDPKIDRIGFKHLLKEKKTLQLILCGIFIFGTNVANNTYYGFLFRDGGGTVAGIGLVFLLMVGSEAPFMGLAPKLALKFTQEKLIAIAILISALRFGWYATGPSYQWLIATFFLQGAVNGIILVEYMKYISSVVNPRLIGIAVSAFYAISSNGGTILCNFFGGMIMDKMGSTGVYGFFSILNVIGLILYLGFKLDKPKREKNVEKGIDKSKKR
ncbi:MAG: MFS transporter [Eubacteriales bacterium]|nr:MFS transporter [Eubacteriales bacterium]